MLQVKNLYASVDSQEILKGIDLDVGLGEVHAIMGPNGSGKSTFAKILAGHSQYEVTQGSVSLLNEDLLSLEPHERAHRGLFMSFQYPVEIPGVSNLNFLKAAVNAIYKAQGKQEMDAIDFLSFIREKAALVGMDEELLYRNVNEGFSGGEKKRNEILQMAVLEPKLAILDETDSGLDIDSLKVIAEGINTMRAKDRSIILVTHYQRLLNYIEPDYIHVLYDGRIIKSGDKSLAKELEAKGYGWISENQQHG